MSRSVGDRRSTSTLPGRASVDVGPGRASVDVGFPKVIVGPPKLINKWEFRTVNSVPAKTPSTNGAIAGDEEDNISPLYYQKMQCLVQEMLHSEMGVPVRSHRNRLLSAVPSVFTGSDLIHWIARKIHCAKPEAAHIALMLYKHGYFFSVDRDDSIVKEDNTLFRFQTPHLWPSQSFDDSDFAYSIYLVKQVKKSKNRVIKLADYQVASLRYLQKHLKSQWNDINYRADEEVRIIKEQKKIARNLLESQEKAFWRLRRPPPEESKITDCVLTKFGMERKRSLTPVMLQQDSTSHEIQTLKEMLIMRTHKLSTTLHGLVKYSTEYSEFDPLLKSPTPRNPWITNDETLWTLERSFVEYPNEQQLKKWKCSFRDMLRDVTGRYNFEKFCQKQYSSENIRFWQAVQDLKMLPLVSVPGSVSLIYDEFISQDAHSMVNVSANAVKEAEQDLLNPSRYSFSLAQDEIYKLMKTDIYPRFLKADYETLLKSATSNGSIGKGFLKKFKPKTHNSKSDSRSSPVEIISPNHPQRFTKRQLSISKKPHGSSMDNIFLSVKSLDGNNPISTRENSDLINALTSPTSENYLVPPPDKGQSRRISTPNISLLPPEFPPLDTFMVTTNSNGVSNHDINELDLVHEDKEEYETEDEIEDEIEEMREFKKVGHIRPRFSERRISDEKAIRRSMMYSRSMEDLSQLAEDADGIQMAPKDPFQMGLMSLRTPKDMFDVEVDTTKLNRKTSIKFGDLFNSPEQSFSPSFISTIRGSDTNRSSISTQSPVTIKIPPPDHHLHSSNESVHSTISANY